MCTCNVCTLYTYIHIYVVVVHVFMFVGFIGYPTHFTHSSHLCRARCAESNAADGALRVEGGRKGGRARR